MISTTEKRTVPFQVLDVSFSSYLNDTQDTFIQKHAQSSQIIQISSLHPVPPPTAFVGKNKVEDGEIGIFGAEKYFTEVIDDQSSVIPNKGGNAPTSICQQQERDESPVKHKTQPGTPSVRSEASWNSRSALLQTNPKNRKEVNKVGNIKSFLSALGCNCNGKNSVQVGEQNCQDRVVVHTKEITKPVKAGNSVARTTKSLSTRWAEEEIQIKKLDHPNPKREDSFSFPVISAKAGDPAVVKIQLQEDKETIRNSLEVFGSPIMENARKSYSLERKLTMLNWDGVATDIEIPPNQNVMYNDAESDASSDLFEIESFSTNGNSFPGRHAAEEMSKPSNCYAPSEASIDWSVATASAADASVISNYKDIRNGTAKSSSMIAWSMKIDNKTSNCKEVVPKKAPSLLTGCNSLKSVRVAGDEYRTSSNTDKEAAGRLRLESGTPITKFQAETKLTGLDSRSRGQNGFGTRSHSPHILYIQ